MARIAFILLCHKDPAAVIAQSERLTVAGNFVSIHFDKRAGKDAFKQIKHGLAHNPNVTFATKRIKCSWGAWSLVQATLNAVEAAESAFPRATHFYMLSGDCMPIKSSEYMQKFLDEDDRDFIESFDFFDSGWIKTGIQEERLIYRHFVAERNHKWLFYKNLEIQKWLGLERAIPKDLTVMIGSQWWCLRRETIEKILAFKRERRDVMRFFATTWIPDETFFQTLVSHLIPQKEISTNTLTFLMFTDYGMPVVFYNDHYDLLLAQDYLFARKISENAHVLRARLGDVFAKKNASFSVSNEGRALFKFLAERGRVGKRFGSRFWETESTLGRERTLMMIVCKRWHVAKQLTDAIRSETKHRCLDYIFNEVEADLPDLGGIGSTIEKRTRHRRAWLRMIFDYYETSELVVCMDPSGRDLIHDFYDDRSESRLLEISTNLTEGFVRGHAERVGLAGPNTPENTLGRILPAIKRDLQSEADTLRDAEYAGHEILRDGLTKAEMSQRLARFLNCSIKSASAIISKTDLFKEEQ